MMTKVIGRFLLPLIAAFTFIAAASFPYAKHLTDQWLERDLETRAELIFSIVENDLKEALANKNGQQIQQLFQSITKDNYLQAIGYCSAHGELVYRSKKMPASFTCQFNTTSTIQPIFASQHLDGNSVLLAEFPLDISGKFSGALVMMSDPSFVERRHQDAYRALGEFLLATYLIVILFAVLITSIILRGWINTVNFMLQKEASGYGTKHKDIPMELKPLILSLYRLLRRRHHNRQTINPANSTWDAGSLQQFLRTELPDEEIIVASNREPYVHNNENGEIVLHTSAGGLVSALEPVMRACRGVWVAHGSGTADKAVVDHHDHIPVPPDRPSYTLRRVWLNEEEELGFYHGFANEGLWPLCHLVFTRPIFRDEDWQHYQTVNRKFADAVASEARTKSPVILVQDYHFSLLPALIHARMPQAIVATFWHIPWPNAESFSICPWREEILNGLLSSDILGFHTQFHCNNFLDTVDRFLECRVDREHGTVTIGGRTTLVRPYPISIEWLPSAITSLAPAPSCRDNILKQLNLPSDMKLGIGVERFDYTKGIIDRFQAIDRFFHENPSWIGKLVFIQIAAPTRNTIQRYREEQEETTKLAEAINAELGNTAWQPIILIVGQYSQNQVYELFRAADFCIVSSLHDGMNLVAKEFVAAREDEKGVLILSTFAGASEELTEALIVNPHDIKGMAVSIHHALRMPLTEQSQRMRFLRNIVRNHNIYWWAGQLLMGIALLRKSSKISANSSHPRSKNGFHALPPTQSVLRHIFSTKRRSKSA